MLTKKRNIYLLLQVTIRMLTCVFAHYNHDPILLRFFELDHCTFIGKLWVHALPFFLNWTPFISEKRVFDLFIALN